MCLLNGFNSCRYAEGGDPPRLCRSTWGLPRRKRRRTWRPTTLSSSGTSTTRGRKNRESKKNVGPDRGAKRMLLGCSDGREWRLTGNAKKNRKRKQRQNRKPRTENGTSLVVVGWWRGDVSSGWGSRFLCSFWFCCVCAVPHKSAPAP